eukprot:5890763-Pleurochrysis_carterae.AAC.1
MPVRDPSVRSSQLMSGWLYVSNAKPASSMAVSKQNAGSTGIATTSFVSLDRVMSSPSGGCIIVAEVSLSSGGSKFPRVVDTLIIKGCPRPSVCSRKQLLDATRQLSVRLEQVCTPPRQLVDCGTWMERDAKIDGRKGPVPLLAKASTEPHTSQRARGRDAMCRALR